MALAKMVPGGEIPVFLTAVLSHLALDAIPHGDTGIGHWVHSSQNCKTKLSRLLPMSVADQVIALVVFLVLMRSPLFASVPLSILLAGAVGSMPNAAATAGRREATLRTAVRSVWGVEGTCGAPSSAVTERSAARPKR